MEITKEYLNSKFTYYENGQLFHKNSKTRAGTLRKSGYRQVYIRNKYYYEHRVIFFMFHGFFPKEVDHINGNRSDNRIQNLIASNRLQNNRNLKSHRSGKLLGAHKINNSNKWRAIINLNKKAVHLGVFDSMEEAHAAFLKCEEENKQHFMVN